MSRDELTALKYFRAKLPLATIASKMGKSLGEVSELLQSAETQLKASITSGHSDLCDRFQVLCHQYQLVGESLKIFAQVLGNTVPLSELAEDMGSDTLAEKLTSKYIVLRPFVPLPPPEDPEALSGN